MVRGCCGQALNHASICPSWKQRQLVHLKTTFNDENFFFIAIKKLRLKKFMKFRLQLQKKNSITKKNSVSFTNRRWPTPNSNVCCVTRQYFFSEGPTCLFKYKLFKYKLFKDLCHSQSRWFTTTYYVTKRRARTVLISEFPAPSLAIYINLLRQFPVVQTGRENE